MALTDTQIRKAQCTAKAVKLFDGDGLFLHLMPTGSKIWRVAYRVDGKQKLLTVGKYPAVTLAEARGKCAEGRKILAKDIDPVEHRRQAKQARLAASEHSFETVTRQWYEHWKGSKNPRHAGYVLARLEADVFPAIGPRPIAEIQAPELVAMVKKIESRGAKDIAKRCLQMTGQIFRYAIAHGSGGATRNPATDIKPMDVLTPRIKENYARIDAKELPTLLRKIEGYAGTPTTRLAIKLMALTFVRTGELIGARWEEFDFEGQRWNIPASRMKMKTPHIVPLSKQAIEVLQVLHGVTGDKQLLFPGERDHDKPMSNNTILGALDRMGYAGRMTGHGFRGVASTILHEHGFPSQHIELQLAHMERNAVTAAYNHAKYLQQRTAMMHWYGDYLEGLTRGNVVTLHGRAA
jgi:integrase